MITLVILSALLALQLDLEGSNEELETFVSAKDKAPPAAGLPECVTFKTQARFVMGYDHLVHITNECDKVAACEVWTDVNPEKQSVRIAPTKTETVLTYRGSPARTFKAEVTCSLEESTR